jgi:predicted nuclease of predicted toxin-antitoxin system
VRFLVDANLSPRLAVSLTEAGHDAVHVADLGMSRATDLGILEVADRDDPVVVYRQVRRVPCRGHATQMS